MNPTHEPTHIVELNMNTVVKQMFYWTGISLAFLLILYLIIHRPFDVSISFFSTMKDITLFSIGYIVLIVLHEFFHLFGFRIFSNVPWRKMKVGVNLKLGIAYATTSQLMTNRAIRKSLLLPFWLTGILPALIGIYIGSSLLLILSALLIGGAAGDFSMYRQLKKFPDDWLIQDHPSEPKLFLFNPDIQENTRDMDKFS